MLNGYKTYIVCAVTIVYAGVAVWAGSLDLNGAAQFILVALGAAGFRSAIAK